MVLRQLHVSSTPATSVAPAIMIICRNLIANQTLEKSHYAGAELHLHFLTVVRGDRQISARSMRSGKVPGADDRGRSGAIALARLSVALSGHRTQRSNRPAPGQLGAKSDRTSNDPRSCLFGGLHRAGASTPSLQRWRRRRVPVLAAQHRRRFRLDRVRAVCNPRLA